jgi:hypothetical protein
MDQLWTDNCWILRQLIISVIYTPSCIEANLNHAREHQKKIAHHFCTITKKLGLMDEFSGLLCDFINIIKDISEGAKEGKDVTLLRKHCETNLTLIVDFYIRHCYHARACAIKVFLEEYTNSCLTLIAVMIKGEITPIMEIGTNMLKHGRDMAEYVARHV